MKHPNQGSFWDFSDNFLLNLAILSNSLQHRWTIEDFRTKMETFKLGQQLECFHLIACCCLDHDSYCEFSDNFQFNLAILSNSLQPRWTIEDFRTKMETFKLGQQLESSQFVINGLKLCINLYPNGRYAFSFCMTITNANTMG